MSGTIWGWRSSRSAAVLFAAIVFTVGCVLPTAYMLAAATTSIDSLASLRLLLDSRRRSLLGNTILVGSGTATLAVILGGALGWCLARIEFPFKKTARLALAAPIVLPPYVIALAWSYLAGTAAFTVGGVITVLTMAFYPIAMLATEVGLRQINPAFEEAALLVTTPADVVRRITAPLVLPHVAGAGLIIFVLAISDFSVPGLLQVRVFTTEVFTAFAALYDFAGATVLALPLLMASCVIGGCAALALANRLVTTTRQPRAATTQLFRHGRVVAVGSIMLVALVVLGVPLAVLTTEALATTAIMPILRSSRPAVLNSILLATIGATTITSAAALLGYGRARTTALAGAVIDSVCLILFTVPSTIVGIGLIGVWNRGVWGSVYGTGAMLVLVYVARFLPIATLLVAASVRAVPESQEEAAAVAGARWGSTAFRIVWPQIRGALFAVWVLTFVLSFGEVGASILVAPPGESTLPIRVYTLTANAPPGHVAVLALFQTVVVLSPLVLLGMTVPRQET